MASLKRYFLTRTRRKTSTKRASKIPTSSSGLRRFLIDAESLDVITKHL
jgi:hypothetical protein